MGEAISSIPSAIIDVVELPTENIDEDSFYRLLTGTFYWNGGAFGAYTCYIVETLPEIGEPATNADMSELCMYYNLSDKTLKGYITDDLAAGLGIPVGWYLAEQLFPVADINYGGIVLSPADASEDQTIYLVLEGTLYQYSDSWKALNQVGWRGSGNSSEIFNSLQNIANGNFSHAEGFRTIAGNIGSNTDGDYSHAEGYASHAEGDASHAEGYASHAEGYASHAEGYASHAEGNYSHAEGNFSHAEGNSSHAEGYYSHAEGDSSHAEGNSSHAEGDSSHAEGNSSRYGIYITGTAGSTIFTVTNNAIYLKYLIKGAKIRYKTYRQDQHGDNWPDGFVTAKIIDFDIDNSTITIDKTEFATEDFADKYVDLYTSHLALGNNSHIEGLNNIAVGRSQHVEGEYNIPDDANYSTTNNNIKGKYVHIVGNGASNARSNAHTLDWDGNAWFQGEVYVGGSSQDDESAVKLAKISDIPSTEGLATESYVDNKIANLVNSAPEALNTLDELAAALGDDENFATTVTNQIASKQNAITGTAGQFVVIGDDGKPTTKTIPIAEEGEF